jgi:isopentenyl diphosphate isomerase/L-lactate dehydrogenase-like FMN-dependent dehydrogenase
MHSIADLRLRARARLPRVVFDFIDGGAGDEATLRRNESAFQELRLVPRVFVPCRTRDLSTTLLGQRYAMPFGVTPMGLCNLAWPGTDLGIARAAAGAGIPYALSTMASTSIEDIARAAPQHTWFQLYVGGDAAIADSLIDRALAAGIRTLVLTVDANFTARRLRDRRNRFALPLRATPRLLADLASHPTWSLSTLAAGAPTFENFKPTATNPRSINIADMLVALAQAHIDWSLLEHARKRWPHTLIVKGVLHPADARRVAAMGADGVVVSNHGGRQLAAVPSSIEALPAIRQAVGPDFAVLLDSGVRSGDDIAKALAAGANFVLLGRTFLYGTGALGAERGPATTIDILRGELDTAMAQLGCSTVEDLRSAAFFTPSPASGATQKGQP